LAAFDGPSPKTRLWAQKSLTQAHFVPNFVAMATGVGRGKVQLAAFDGPSPKKTHSRKNLAKISSASRVIANFVPNFVAMATGVGRGDTLRNVGRTDGRTHGRTQR